MKVVNNAPWHTEYYLTKGVEVMSRQAGIKLHDLIYDEDLKPALSWQAWFEQTYPDLHAKYRATVERINALWGDKTPQGMEEFKAAVKKEVEATTWAVNKYITEYLTPMINPPLHPSREGTFCTKGVAA